MYGLDRDKMRHIRDLFYENVPAWLISRLYSIPIRGEGKHRYNLLDHAWRQNWYKRREIQIPLKRIVQLAALGRLRESWDKFDKKTADKMLVILEKIEAGTGKRKLTCPHCGGEVVG